MQAMFIRSLICIKYLNRAKEGRENSVAFDVLLKFNFNTSSCIINYRETYTDGRKKNVTMLL